ncbi:hypothetical protein GQ53DRAFT_751167 [Thozetella sp. PMI_491]|nr:hypothetical protein GQ53DRAFT_751167 [Thozetella sp. PMI_491]
MVLSYRGLPGYGAEEPHKAHIRLLHLQPSPNRNSPIKISLEVAPLAMSTDYEALSYVWGDQAKEAVKKAIKCDNTTVDAICINQQDVHEKCQQVAIMGSIFTRAKRVLVRLGPAADESDVAIRYVK